MRVSVSLRANLHPPPRLSAAVEPLSTGGAPRVCARSVREQLQITTRQQLSVTTVLFNMLASYCLWLNNLSILRDV